MKLNTQGENQNDKSVSRNGVAIARPVAQPFPALPSSGDNFHQSFGASVPDVETNAKRQRSNRMLQVVVCTYIH